MAVTMIMIKGRKVNVSERSCDSQVASSGFPSNPPPPSVPSIFRYLDGSSITKLMNSFDSMTTIEEGGMKWCHVIRGFEVVQLPEH